MFDIIFFNNYATLFILYEWLFEVVSTALSLNTFSYHSHIFNKTINLFERVVKSKKFEMNNATLQKIGVSCIVAVSDLSEKDAAYLTANTYTKDEIIKCVKDIKALQNFEDKDPLDDFPRRQENTQIRSIYLNLMLSKSIHQIFSKYNDEQIFAIISEFYTKYQHKKSMNSMEKQILKLIESETFESGKPKNSDYFFLYKISPDRLKAEKECRNGEYQYSVLYNYANIHDEPKLTNLCTDLSELFSFDKLLGSGSYGEAWKVIALKTLDGIDGDLVIKKSELKNKNPFYENCIENVNYIAKNGEEQEFKNAYYCRDDSPHIEYIMSQVASTFDSINFIKVYAYAPCESDDYSYILMEKLEGDVNDLMKKADPADAEYIDILLIQLLSMIASMQNIQMMHNDIHFRNIFYMTVTDQTTYKGKRIRDYKYVSYEFPSLNLPTIYIPTEKLKYILKLADFGLSVKYSDPPILNDHVIGSNSMTNYYNTAYDIIIPFFVLLRYYRKTIENSQLFLKLVSWIFRIPTDFNNLEGKAWWLSNKKVYKETLDDKWYNYLEERITSKNVDNSHSKLLTLYTELLVDVTIDKTKKRNRRFDMNVDLTQLISQKYKAISARNALKYIDTNKLFDYPRNPKDGKILNISKI